MQLRVGDILYQKWEQIPLKHLAVILQLLPFVNWEQHDDWMNTYCKNIILKYLFKDRKLYKKTTAAQRVDIFTYELDWLRNPTHRFLIPTVKVKGTVFHAPEDGLSNLTIDHLSEADTRLSRYMISTQAKYLDSFLACLYSVENEIFNQKVINEKALLLGTIPDFQKISILSSYLGSRQVITRLCPDLFPEPERKKDDKKRKPIKPVDLGPMWNELIFELANTKGYPGVALARQANAYEALQYLNREIKNARKQNQQRHA